MGNYSQNNEEEIILNYFNGFPRSRLLDIGAFDGITFSNTKALLNLGWNGVMVEASKGNFDAMVNHLIDDHAVCLRYAVMGQHYVGDTVTFYDSGEAISTTEIAHRDKWSKVGKFTETIAPTITIKHLLDKCGDDFRMINIDTESTSANLFLEALPLFTNCLLWVVEYDDKEQECRQAAADAGFKVLLHNGENLIFAK